MDSQHLGKGLLRNEEKLFAKNISARSLYSLFHILSLRGCKHPKEELFFVFEEELPISKGIKFDANAFILDKYRTIEIFMTNGDRMNVGFHILSSRRATSLPHS